MCKCGKFSDIYAEVCVSCPPDAKYQLPGDKSDKDLEQEYQQLASRLNVIRETLRTRGWADQIKVPSWALKGEIWVEPSVRVGGVRFIRTIHEEIVL